jgi:hypothetical protein
MGDGSGELFNLPLKWELASDWAAETEGVYALLGEFGWDHAVMVRVKELEVAGAWLRSPE